MKYLLEPINYKRLNLKNRLVMPPMATEKADTKGSVSQAMLDYYDEKSKGGYFGLVIIEHSFISENGQASEGQLSIADDSLIPDLKKLADVIHKNGSKVFMQINHAGSGSRILNRFEPVGPSPLANYRTKIIPKQLSKMEIAKIVQDFKNAALRVKAAGFDGVEIHSAHGYLLDQFYSPITNNRSDEYGQAVRNRIRIHLEVIKAVRKAVGTDFPISLRLGVTDFDKTGVSVKDDEIAAIEFEKADIDLLSISGGLKGYLSLESNRQGYFSDFSEAIKKEINVPVLLTGGVTDVLAAEQLLKDHKADLIGVGRAVYKDSSWSKQAFETLKNY